jgi:uncharacterized protein (TIGR03382 family)
VPVDEDAGIKFRGATEITAFDAHLIQTEGQSATCEGDSGGPLIDASGAVAGITSFGLNMECFGSTSLFTRVSRHAQLIAAALAWTPTCPDAAPESCNGRDDNCDGTIDEVCMPIGASCRSNAECEGGLCASLDGELRCTRACDPAAALPDCAAGNYCRALGCGLGRCVAGVPGAGDDGAQCSAGSQCAAGHCGSVDGKSICGRMCREGGDACPMGQLCDTSDGASGCGTCVPVAISRELRPFAAPCETAAQCESGMCNDAGTRGAFCSRRCDTERGCGNGMRCRDQVCVAGALGTSGNSCLDGMDCGVAAPECVEHGRDRVCAAPCGDDAPCGTGFDCVAAPDERRHCLRIGAPLGAACSMDGPCATGVCRDGSCARACSEASPCPQGFACEAPATGVGFCTRLIAEQSHDDGGCATASRQPSSSTWVLLTIALGWLVRRRQKPL